MPPDGRAGDTDDPVGMSEADAVSPGEDERPMLPESPGDEEPLPHPATTASTPTPSATKASGLVEVPMPSLLGRRRRDDVPLTVDGIPLTLSLIHI